VFRFFVDAAGITFAVADTGTGISADHLDLVLQSFVQVDGSLSSRRHEGTGLGLTSSKQWPSCTVEACGSRPK
jgi:signal transduction histidine kinase